jgi:hypothetical protein
MPDAALRALASVSLRASPECAPALGLDSDKKSNESPPYPSLREGDFTFGVLEARYLFSISYDAYHRIILKINDLFARF